MTWLQNFKHRLGAPGTHEDDHFYVTVPVTLPGTSTDAWRKNIPNMTETGEMIFQWSVAHLYLTSILYLTLYFLGAS